MNPILDDFSLDLRRLKKILALTESIGALRSETIDPVAISETQLRDVILRLQLSSQDSHPEMPILNGVLLLYLAGRFENFVREVFEDLSDVYASKAGEFRRLPKQMRENLAKYTAMVVADPRKYGHADKGVASFVRMLSDNLNGLPLQGVNSQCLSITHENMRPQVFADLFGRIGVGKLWERIGQQAHVQQFFEVDQAEKATAAAMKFLQNFMELRNQIAHPSGTLTWPRIDETIRHIEFCEVIGKALNDLCQVTATSFAREMESTAGEVEMQESQ